MIDRWARWGCGLVLALAVTVAGPVSAQTTADADKLNTEVIRLYQAGRSAEAIPIAQQALSIREKALGPEHPDVGTALNNLAGLYQAQGRYAEAEPLSKRSLSLREKALGPDHPSVGQSLNNLAGLYENQGRTTEAEPLYKRSLSIWEKALGPDHPQVGASLNNLAGLYQHQGRYPEAEPLYKRSLGIREKALGPDHPQVGTALNNLAGLYQTQGRYPEAEPLYKRTVSIFEKALGPDHPNVGTALNDLALLYDRQGRYPEAEPLYKRSLDISEKALGPDHPDVGTALNNLAVLYLTQRDWTPAADYWRRSTALTVRRARLGTAVAGAPLGKGKSETDQLGYRFLGLVKVVHRLATERYGMDAGLPPARFQQDAREMFQTGQWALGSEAAVSLAQMAARGAKGDPNLARVVRDRQDLVTEWQRRDGARTAAVSQAPDERDATAEAANTARLIEIEGRIAAIDKRLAAEFPDYAALASPEPLTVEQVQADLRPDEALVLFLDTDDRFKPIPEETFLWVVTKADVRWIRSQIGTAALQREVAALRCGLGATAWDIPDCATLTGVVYTAVDRAFGKPLPFDAARAHKLYKALFGEVDALIKDKHLLIVPSGALNALPFQVLVTQMPADAIPKSFAGYAATQWLGARNAVTILPAVSSLKALRSHASPSRADQPYIGFGNPLLLGRSGTDKSAFERQRCPEISTRERVRLVLNGVAPKLASLMRGGLGEVEDLRKQPPLPETADELCAVARSRGSSNPDHVVNLGARATETRVKQLSADGTLSRAKVLHFATHGLIAGETATLAKSLAEPALLLTPPETATEQDDGLLTASEVASLKLDADWVILSACNTASGDTIGGDALSGLARAFFYAGARALLVSHWYVDSEATVALVTKSFDALQADPKSGRAEALRRASLSLIKSGTRMAHPANWAPFIVVGEGGAGR